MKNIFLAVLITLLSSCTLSKPCKMNRMITGYWKLDSVRYTDIKAEMQDEVNKSTADMLPGSNIVFTKKNEFSYKITDYSGTGNWKFTDEFNKLYFDKLFLKPDTKIDIIELNKKRLVVLVPSGDMKMRLVFTKR